MTASTHNQSICCQPSRKIAKIDHDFPKICSVVSAKNPDHFSGKWSDIFFLDHYPNLQWVQKLCMIFVCVCERKNAIKTFFVLYLDSTQNVSDPPHGKNYLNVMFILLCVQFHDLWGVRWSGECARCRAGQFTHRLPHGQPEGGGPRGEGASLQPDRLLPQIRPQTRM